MTAAERRAGPTFTSATAPTVSPKHESASEPAPVEFASLPFVRPMQATDLRRLRGVPAVHRADQPESLLTGYSSLRHGVRSLWPFPRERTRMFIATDRRELVGFADFVPVGRDLRWQLVAIGISPEGMVRHATEALIRYGTIAAGNESVRRLYATLPLDSPLMADVLAVGFRPYAELDIMVANTLQRCQMPTALRRQEQVDTWAIHQLYASAVPRQVQYAEAYTSHFWDVKVRRGTSTEVRGWILEEGHQLAGYLRIVSRQGRHVVEVVVAPDRCDALEILLAGAAAFIAARTPRRIYAAIPSYLQHFTSEFEHIGFETGWRQQQLVKYTTVTARAPLYEAVLAPVDARERATKRVPTFMQTPRHEEVASRR